MKQADLKLAAKYFPNKKREKIDTVAAHEYFGRNDGALMDAFNAWMGLDMFRRMCERNERYTFDDQWGDFIKDPRTCEMITERAHIMKEGNVPLQNNRILGIVRTVSGVFQSAQTEPVCIARDRDEQGKGEVMSSTLQYVYQNNKMWGLDTSMFMYFLVTGIGLFKSTYGWRNGKMDVWTDTVNYRRIFLDNHMEDTRHWDCHLIGEIHDLGLYDVIAKFSNGSPARATKIRQMYSSYDNGQTISLMENLIGKTYSRRFDNFSVSTDTTVCRVIEIWRKESKERLRVHDRLTGEYYKAEIEEWNVLNAENEARRQLQASQGVTEEDMKLLEIDWFVDNYWYYYYMTPWGDVLQEGETPFWHESHPYSFKIYPFFNGKVHPFVSGFIDQQRYINRLITLQDFVTRASAKGVLAVDQTAIPDGWTPENYTDEWAVYNGVLLYTSKNGAKPPHQIVSNSSQLGLTDMLSIQMKLLEDISGVQGALQGQAPSSGTPAALYIQQTQNSASALTEIFEAFKELREERDMKNLKLIQQFYTDPRYMNITGRSAKGKYTVYDPDQVRNTEFDLSITESTQTPAYRMLSNDFLMQLFSMQQITLEELLQNGSFPFADKLLQSIEARKQAMEQGQLDPGLSPELAAQMQANNPLVQKILSNNVQI